MKLTDGFYIATDDADFKWAMSELQHDIRVDWQSIKIEPTIRGCTPIWWKLKGEENDK